MNARPIETSLEVRTMQEKAGLNPDLTRASSFREIAAEATLYGWDDAEESRAELIKGIKAACPFPWRHGGLNE